MYKSIYQLVYGVSHEKLAFTQLTQSWSMQKFSPQFVKQSYILYKKAISMYNDHYDLDHPEESLEDWTKMLDPNGLISKILP